jgi:hypothetical protein
VITITMSTDGRETHTMGGRECHKVEDVEYARTMGEEHRNVSKVRLTLDQAYTVLDDLLVQINRESGDGVVLYRP